MTTLCINCDNVHPDTRKWEPWKWRCLAVPVEPGYGFVDPNYSPAPPYERCVKINGGECPFFEAVRVLETTTNQQEPT